MDTIDVQKLREQHENGQSGDEYIALVLNGEVLKGTFDVHGFVCTADLSQITYEVMTCSCGHAGCAGIWDGTAIKQRRFTVEWRDIDSGLPKRFYRFHRPTYAAVVAKALHLMYEIVEKREQDGVDRDGMYGVLSDCTVEDLERGLAYTKAWYKKVD